MKLNGNQPWVLPSIPKGGGGTSCCMYKFDDYALKIEGTEQWIRDLNLFEREIVALNMIQQFDWAPKVKGVMKRSRAILMMNAGDKLTPENIPDDAESQIKKIYEDLDSIGLRNDDVGLHEFMVDKNGKITLVDWGECSLWGDNEEDPRDPTLGGQEELMGSKYKMKSLYATMGLGHMYKDASNVLDYVKKLRDKQKRRINGFKKPTHIRRIKITNNKINRSTNKFAFPK